MGRHSAPDDPDVESVEWAATGSEAVALQVAVARGRHASADPDFAADDARTQRIAVVDEPLADPPSAAASAEPAADVRSTDTLDTAVIAPVDATVPPPPYAAPVPPPAQEQPGGRADKKAAKAEQAAAKAASKSAAKGSAATAKADAKAAKQADKEADKAARQADKAAQRAARADAKSAKPRGESATRADLRMLHENSAVRAQAIGAVVSSFLVYTVVLIVLGSAADYLFWLWIPIIASGVLVGLVLDLAHRRAGGAS